MNKIAFFSSFVLFFCLISGCKDDEPIIDTNPTKPEEKAIVLSEKDIVVASAGETVKIEISPDIDFEYSLPNAEWIHKENSPTSDILYFKVDENDTYDSRIAEIKFTNKSNRKNEIVKITQMQKAAIIVAKDSYSFDGEENILEFDINTSVDFNTEISVAWIKANTGSPSRGLTEKHVSFIIAKNPSTEQRSGSIKFKYEDITQEIIITQDGRIDMMNIAITHCETEFAPIVYQGNLVAGTVDWGDGAKSDITEGHSFSNNKPKTSTFETMGVDVFRIESLNSISSIIIYVNDEETDSNNLEQEINTQTSEALD